METDEERTAAVRASIVIDSDARDRLVAALAAVYRPAPDAGTMRAVLEDLADAAIGAGWTPGGDPT